MIGGFGYFVLDVFDCDLMVIVEFLYILFLFFFIFTIRLIWVGIANLYVGLWLVLFVCVLLLMFCWFSDLLFLLF